MGLKGPLPTLATADLHQHLWDRRDRRNVVHIVQLTVAREIGHSKYVVHRTMKRMVAENRVRPLLKTGLLYGKFEVADPAQWKRDTP